MVACCSGKTSITLLHSSSSSSSSSSWSPSLLLHLYQSSRLHLSFWVPTPQPFLPSLRTRRGSTISAVTLKQETSVRGNNPNENALAHGNGKGKGNGKEENSAVESWETELQAGLNPLVSLHRGSVRKGRHRRGRQIDGAEEEDEEGKDGGEEKVSFHTSTPADWAEQARKRAILSLEARNPPAAKFLERKINNDIKQNKKKKKKKDRRKEEEEGKGTIKEIYNKVFVESKKSEREPSLEWMKNGGSVRKNSVYAKIDDDADDAYGKIDEDEDTDVKIDDDDEDSDINDINGLLEVTELYDWERADVQQLDPDTMNKSNRNVEERIFNRRLVEAMGASDVLEIIDRMEEEVGSASVLTPFNIATALHRIAKHMEASAAHESERLAFARKRSMAKLVARAMEVLPTCSARGLANIAWALSKVGGSSLYFSEMDLIARVSLPKASEFNAQNVANMSGAYASMRHAAPDLFAQLCYHASEIVDTFSPQELAQVLWAHAELAQPADTLLYALDRMFAMPEERRNDSHDQSTITPSLAMIKPFRNASAEHLSNVAWSYCALDQLKRSSFQHIWRMLEDQIAQDQGENRKVLSVWHLCQLHQVNLCLQYEYPQLGLSLSASLKDIASEAWKTQKSNSSASAYQKDVQWHLISMGKGWVTEYRDADYSLDFALVEEKTALEFDGPSHFIRNTGLPLGHTLLKRRLLASSGWRILSIPYAEWEELDGEAEQMQYLKQLLVK